MDCKAIGHLKTSNKILKSILKATGSQWRDLSDAVMCFLFFVQMRQQHSELTAGSQLISLVEHRGGNCSKR